MSAEIRNPKSERNPNVRMPKRRNGFDRTLGTWDLGLGTLDFGLGIWNFEFRASDFNQSIDHHFLLRIRSAIDAIENFLNCQARFARRD